MLANYLNIALRNLRKSPVYSGINLAGLALGTACCLYILLYVRDHQGYDQHHQGGERIYRVVSDLSKPGDDPLKTACVSPPIAPTLAIDFLKLVVFAIVLASPIAWWSMDKWLHDFAYRVDIQWWVFLGAGAVALAIAFLTVSFQSVRAALANPVKSLRSE